MSFLNRLVGRKPPIDAASARIDQLIYLMNYREHYAPILGEHESPRILCELYLFRGWTTQFGYRIFSSSSQMSEKLIGDTVNLSKYLGRAVFEKTHGFAIEQTLGSDFMDLLEERWQAYDVRVSTASGESIPTMSIIGALTDFMGVHDPFVTFKLSTDFLTQLDTIKRIALEIGLLASR